MKLTESMLRKIIKEEVQAVLNEEGPPLTDAELAQMRKGDKEFLRKIAQEEKKLYALMDKLSKAGHAKAKTDKQKKKAVVFSKAVQEFLNTIKQAADAVKKMPDRKFPK